MVLFLIKYAKIKYDHYSIIYNRTVREMLIVISQNFDLFYLMFQSYLSYNFKSVFCREILLKFLIEDYLKPFDKRPQKGSNTLVSAD